MGCTSNLGGNQGVVWIVESKADLDHILKSGPTPPYVAILKREHYSRENILTFKSNINRVAGVVLIAGEEERFNPEPFSPDYTCPNRYSGLYVNDSRYQDCRSNSWQQNSPVSGLLYYDIPFPIFYMNETKTIADIKSCFVQNNLAKGDKRKQDTYPLCSMQLDSFMLAAGNTETCINSRSLVDELLQTNGRRCYTIDNQNIFAFYKQANGSLIVTEESSKYGRPDVVKPQSLTLLIAKLSSISMFTELSPGADSTITSIVTLLAVANALGKVRKSTKVENNPKNIAFALLDSEPFDYTGSSRMVYDMQSNTFPQEYVKFTNESTNAMLNVNLSSIEYIINLDQLANYPELSKLFLHTNPDDNVDNPKLAKVVDVMKKISSNLNIELIQADHNTPLPPTPVHQFIKQSQSLAENIRPMGFVVSNYGKNYSNTLYNSIYDDSRNVYQTTKEKLVEHLTKVGTLIARTLYEITFDDDTTSSIMVEKEVIDELLDCYLTNAECKLFTKAWQAGHRLPSGPVQTYKDPTKPSDDMNGLITANLLAYFIGEPINNYNRTECSEISKRDLIYSYMFINGNDSSGVCFRSQMLKTSSLSPSYRITEDSILLNNTYPAWTVSLNGIRTPARLFLTPSPTQQWCVFLIGVVVSLMSFAIVYQIRGSISRLHNEADLPVGTST